MARAYGFNNYYYLVYNFTQKMEYFPKRSAHWMGMFVCVSAAVDFAVNKIPTKHFNCTLCSNHTTPPVCALNVRKYFMSEVSERVMKDL